ncbi:MAG: hypothetical protein QHG99_00270 [Methanomicrobiales archaeon]|nr:hypothetical protein [Methanomicrobiales archaeon]
MDYGYRKSDRRDLVMSSGESIARRYRQYRWGEKHTFVRYVSLVLLILGVIFVILGSMVPVVLLSGRVILPYAFSTKIALSIIGLVFGLLFGIICMGFSRAILMLKDLEQHARYAMNVWLILEERDFGDAGEFGEEKALDREPAREDALMAGREG